MSSTHKTSYMAVVGQEVPKFSISIEVHRLQEQNDCIKVKTLIKSVYGVHDSDDRVLQSALHTLFLISRELGEKDVSICLSTYIN